MDSAANETADSPDVVSDSNDRGPSLAVFPEISATAPSASHIFPQYKYKTEEIA
jgi:hypothetical protein